MPLYNIFTKVGCVCICKWEGEDTPCEVRNCFTARKNGFRNLQVKFHPLCICILHVVEGGVPVLQLAQNIICINGATNPDPQKLLKAKVLNNCKKFKELISFLNK